MGYKLREEITSIKEVLTLHTWFIPAVNFMYLGDQRHLRRLFFSILFPTLGVPVVVKANKLKKTVLLKIAQETQVLP